MKTCTKCKEAKPLDQFYADKRHADGRDSRCKACQYKASRAWLQSNPAAARAAKNRDVEKRRQKREQDPVAAKAKTAEYRRNNRALLHAKVVEHEAGKLRATPQWASRQAIQEVYAKAGLLRRAGQDVHVDHIVPLRGKNVCGLHVEWNLRIIPATENLSKSNRLLPIDILTVPCYNVNTD